MPVTLPVRGTPNWDISLNAALTYLDNNNTSSSSNALQRANNLSDLTNVPVARANLNLTGLANAQSNMTATTNPTVSSDNTQGYTIGSTWFNTTTNAVFVAANVATGAAVWLQIPPTYVDLTSAQTVAGIKTFSANIIGSAAARIGTTVTVGATASLGDNGVGELQLANATTVPTTNPTGGSLVYSQAGVVKSRNPQGLVVTESGALQAITATTTVSGTGTQTLLTTSIPANDPATGAVYEINAYGTYTSSATATTGVIACSWAGTGIASTPSFTIPASVTGGGFRVRALITFRSTTSVTAMVEALLSTATTATSALGSPTAATTVTTTATSTVLITSNLSVTQGISILGGDVRRIA